MAEHERRPITLRLPQTDIELEQSWKDWNDFAIELTQALAKGLRRGGGSNSPAGGPAGGTPVAIAA
jgi:hypothetical protein